MEQPKAHTGQGWGLCCTPNDSGDFSLSVPYGLLSPSAGKPQGGEALSYPCDGVLVQDQLLNHSGAVVCPHLSSLPLHLDLQCQLVFWVAVV